MYGLNEDRNMAETTRTVVTVAMVYDELHLDWVQFASYLWLAIVLQARSGDFASAAPEFTFSREKR